MKKLPCIAIFISLTIPVFTFLLLILFYPIYDFSTFLNNKIDYILISCMIILTISSFLLILRAIPRYLISKSHLIFLVGCYLMFIGLAGLFSTLWSLFSFTNSRLQTFWVSTTTFILFPALFFLFYFNLEAFYKGINFGNNKLYFTIYAIFLLGLEFITILNVLFEFSNVLFLIIIISIGFGGIFASYTLWRSGFVISHKIVEKAPKKGFLLIGYSGISNIIAFCFNIVYGIMFSIFKLELQLFLWLSWLGWSIGAILLYIGFTLPMKK